MSELPSVEFSAFVLFQCERLVKRVHVFGWLLRAVEPCAVPAAEQALQGMLKSLALARASPAGVSDDAARWVANSSLYCRALVLRTIHSRISIDDAFGSRAQLFAAMPLLASFYYTSLLRSAPLELVSVASNRHLQSMLRPAWFQSYVSLDENMHALSYGVSYIDPQADRFFKKHVNQVLQHVISLNSAAYPRFDPAVKPLPRTVALVSQFYFPAHSVYRTFKQYVDALTDAGFFVTLFNIGSLHASLTPDLLARFASVESSPQESDHDKALHIARLIVDRRFAFVLYPAVGMSWTDVFLSNLRLAPLQIAGLGHSVSGWGNEIDVMLSGESTEVLWTMASGGAKSIRSVFPHAPPAAAAADSAARPLQPRFFTKEYSETLLLLPGQGIIHELPLFSRADLLRISAAAASTSAAELDRVVVNLSASPQKVGVKYIRTLAGIVKRLLALNVSCASESDHSSSCLEAADSADALHVPKLLLLRFMPHLASYLARLAWMRNLLDSFSSALGKAVTHTTELGAQGDSTAQAPMTGFVRIYSSGSDRNSSAPLLTLQLEVYADLPYASYLPLLASGDLSLESAPYGGCNTVVDSLWSGVPLVTFDGEQRWHHRVGSRIVRDWVPEQLAAQMLSNRTRQFQDRAVELITRPLARQKLATALRQLDMESIMLQKQGLPFADASDLSKLQQPSLASSFPQALQWLSRQRVLGRLPSTLADRTRSASIAQQQESIRPSLLRTPVFILREELLGESETSRDRASSKDEL